MKLYRSSAAGALIGARLLALPVALYLFGYAGPQFGRDMPHDSATGLWPLVALFVCAAAAALGGAVGAVVGALKVSRARLATLAGYYVLLATGLSASMLLSSPGWSPLVWVLTSLVAGLLLGVIPAAFVMLLGALLARLPEPPARPNAPKRVEAVFVEWLRQAIALAVANRRQK